MKIKEREEWEVEAEKAGGEYLVQIMVEIRNDQKTILDRLSLMERENVDIQRTIGRIISAFPGGDIEGHQRYHQLMIESIQAKEALRKAIVEKTITGLVFGALGFIGFALLHEIQNILMIRKD